jgi:glycosyltransferase involved in cell wall biosynthesis
MDVSVVIPTYNRRSVVGQAVASALAQTRPPREVIVVDDGSVDGTLDELDRRFGHVANPEVRLIPRPHVNQAAARNTGLAAARGELVAFLDSDDIWYPDYLATQVAVLAGRPDADMVICNGRRQEQDGSWHLQFDHPTWVVPDSVEALWQGSWMQPSFTVVRTKVARAIGFDESFRLAEDLEFVFRFCAAGHVCAPNPAVVAEYRAVTGQGVATFEQLTASNDRNMMSVYHVWRHHSRRYPAALRQGPAFDRAFGELLLRNREWRGAMRHLWRLWRSRPLDADAARKLGRAVTAWLGWPAPPAQPVRAEPMRWLPQHNR